MFAEFHHDANLERAPAPLMQAAPVAPAAPLLEVAGNGKLRVRFAAPPAEPACSEMAVYLRTVGAGGVWGAVDSNTKRLVENGKGNCVPLRTGEVHEVRIPHSHLPSLYTATPPLQHPQTPTPISTGTHPPSSPPSPSGGGGGPRSGVVGGESARNERC